MLRGPYVMRKPRRALRPNPSKIQESIVDYPDVMSEERTIETLLQGGYRGMARYGDGDFNIMRGQRDRYHVPCPKLAKALAETLHRGSNRVLNCLIPPPPTLQHGNLVYQRWHNYLEMNAGLLPFLSNEIYGSSNISRMDSCPHLHTTLWWLQVSKLWQDKDICMVRGSDRSLSRVKLMEAPQAPSACVEILCKPQDNFVQLDEIYAAVLAA